MVAICIESSHQRGLGHLYRCLSLAEELTARGERYIVLLNPDPRSVALLGEKNIPWETVDLWDYESGWEQEIIRRHGVTIWLNDRMGTHRAHTEWVKKAGVRLCAIDDTGSGGALCDCNIIPIPTPGEHYPGKEVYNGSEYVVLPKEIERYRRTRVQQERRIVTLGGSDTYGVTVQVAGFLRALSRPADILLGPAFSHRAALLEALSGATGFRVLESVPSLPALFFEYDLAITGGGMTPYEAAAAGLPTITIANEPHEVPLAEFLQGKGCSAFLGYYKDVTKERLGQALASLKLTEMSEAGQRAFGVAGAAAVVGKVLLKE